MGAMSLVLGCNLDGASGSARLGGCGSGKVGVGLLKWGLGYVSLGSLDVDRSSWWCAISPVLGCDEWVLVCDLRGASSGVSSPVLVCDLASARVRSPWCFRWHELASAGVQSLFLAVSLSLLFSWGGIDLKVKYKQKWFYRVKGHILRSTEMIFRLTQFSLHT